jgi:DNA-directed RNA polymerase subunit RPC12/RpoP
MPGVVRLLCPHPAEAKTQLVVLAELLQVRIKTEVDDEELEEDEEEEEEDLKQLDSSTWKCTICSRTFQTQWKAEDHVAAHRALPGGLTCLMCGRTFQDRLFFAVHMSNQHKKPLS